MTANRFRFRAWDGERMRNEFFIHSSGKIDFDWFGRERNWKIMQSTGLLDKNGKEIFENDILSPPNCTTHKQWIDVSWDNEQACFNLHRRLHYSTVKECEIVGNPYENPLLPMERYC